MDQKPNLPEQINKPRLYLAATGHVFMGLCPDHTQPDSRDPKCPACRLLAAASLSAPPAQEPVPKRIQHYRDALEAILRQPEETMSDGKAVAAMVRIARAALKAKAPASPLPQATDEHPAEEALRSLACWLGVGGYNAPKVDAKLYEQKIREGVAVYSQLHGLAARDLAETVLHMDLITPKGIRARELARQVLGIVPLPQEPQEVKAQAWDRLRVVVESYAFQSARDCRLKEMDDALAHVSFLNRNGGKDA